MGFNCGIVGLPNVGKSALFNALTATQAAEATKYPFSTREANIGRVAVPDERLAVCARLAKSRPRRRQGGARPARRDRAGAGRFAGGRAGAPRRAGTGAAGGSENAAIVERQTGALYRQCR